MSEPDHDILVVSIAQTRDRILHNWDHLFAKVDPGKKIQLIGTWQAMLKYYIVGRMSCISVCQRVCHLVREKRVTYVRLFFRHISRIFQAFLTC